MCFVEMINTEMKKENVNIIKFDYEKENAIRFNSTYCFSLCLL